MHPYASLRKSQDLHNVMNRGRRKSAGGLTVHVLPNDLDTARLGLAVRARGAVERNRIKRRLRSAARAADFGRFDVVVRADERVLALDFQEMVATLKSAAGERA